MVRHQLLGRRHRSQGDESAALAPHIGAVVLREQLARLDGAAQGTRLAVRAWPESRYIRVMTATCATQLQFRACYETRAVTTPATASAMPSPQAGLRSRRGRTLMARTHSAWPPTPPSVVRMRRAIRTTCTTSPAASKPSASGLASVTKAQTTAIVVRTGTKRVVFRLSGLPSRGWEDEHPAMKVLLDCERGGCDG